MSSARTEKRSLEPTKHDLPERIFKYIRIVIPNIGIPFSVFVPIPNFLQSDLVLHWQPCSVDILEVTKATQALIPVYSGIV